MRDRIARTYHVATQAAHNSKSVQVHVGQQVWDYLNSLVTDPPDDDIYAADAEQNRLFGFPILLEKAWDPDKIVVRTEEVVA